jgi:hypothetical protein
MVAVGLIMNHVGEGLVKRRNGYFLLNLYIVGHFRSTSEMSMKPSWNRRAAAVLETKT